MPELFLEFCFKARATKQNQNINTTKKNKHYKHQNQKQQQTTKKQTTNQNHINTKKNKVSENYSGRSWILVSDFFRVLLFSLVLGFLVFFFFFFCSEFCWIVVLI